MFEERDPNAGTLEEQPDGAESGGTPDVLDDGSEAGDDQGKVTISKGELSVWKTKAEKFNDVEAENRQLREALGKAPPTTDANRSEAEAQRSYVAQRQNYLQRMRVAAESGNEEARAVVVAVETALEAEERTLYRLEMFEIPKEERAEVQKFMQQEGIRSPAIARQFMNGGQRFESLRDENARLRAELEEAKKNPPKVETTSTRGASRAGGGARGPQAGKVERITLAEYTARMNDPARYRETARAVSENLLLIDL